MNVGTTLHLLVDASDYILQLPAPYTRERVLEHVASLPEHVAARLRVVELEVRSVEVIGGG